MRASTFWILSGVCEIEAVLSDGAVELLCMGRRDRQAAPLPGHPMDSWSGGLASAVQATIPTPTVLKIKSINSNLTRNSDSNNNDSNLRKEAIVLHTFGCMYGCHERAQKAFVLHTCGSWGIGVSTQRGGGETLAPGRQDRPARANVPSDCEIRPTIDYQKHQFCRFLL